MCKYTEFGKDRAYYDFTAMQDMRRYNLNIIPGYKASMDIYENKILLCTEICHKLINLDTVWDKMEKFYSTAQGGDYKQICFNNLVGQVVMTK
jgi:aubergine